MNDNLKPWPKGTSGNPAGRKKGSRNISTIVRDLLERDLDAELSLDDEVKVIIRESNGDATYTEAAIYAQIVKATRGDLKSATWLFNQVQKQEIKDEEQYKRDNPFDY